ncbi:MAG: hypothetical protein JJU20_04640 [Opitutales bacterium]|nr:hypothetical protein [Opitutales bacterium]
MTLPYQQPVLVLDACGANVQTGICQNGKWLARANSKGDALENLYDLCGVCLRETGLELKQLGAYLFAEGPGSMLGIRLTAMAINTWRCLPGLDHPVFGYRSIDLAALELAEQKHLSNFALVSRLRKKACIVLRSSESRSAEPEVLSDESIQALQEPVWELLLKGRGPQTYPLLWPYSIESLPERLRRADLKLYAHETAAPFQIQKPEYQRWQGERHR